MMGNVCDIRLMVYLPSLSESFKEQYKFCKVFFSLFLDNLPPNDLKFLDNFEESLKCLRSDLDNIILGDFNICMKNKKDQLYEGYKDILNLYDLTQLISNATRVTENTSTLIDHILVNNNDKFVQSGTITLGLSDHNLIYCTRKLSKGQINDHNTVKIRSMKNFDSTLFVEELEKVDWSCCTLSDCVETKF